MTASSRRLGWLPLVMGVVCALGLVQCFGATEVVVDVRTNLACDRFQPRTQIRLGADQTVAETVACDAVPPPDDAVIGTLTFVPSGDRRAKVLVQVVMAVKGARPEDCAAQPDKCIVAKRSFSFIEHSSRRLPVILRGQCLGKVCGEGETCVLGGACVAVEAACLTEACGVTTPPSSTPEPLDGGAGCTNGDVRCTGTRLEECRGGAFVLRDLCATPELCQQHVGATCAIPAPSVCVPSEKKCDGKSVVQCRSDGTAFDPLVVCPVTCSAIVGPAHCITPVCVPNERKCDFECIVSGPSRGTSAEDCLLRCNADGTAFAFEANCGTAQHDLFSDSCRPAPLNGGAECF